MTFGEIEDGAGTGGWFTPARKPPLQRPDNAQHAGEADFEGASAWFGSPGRRGERPGEQPGPGDWPESGGGAFGGRGTTVGRPADRRDPRGPGGGGLWREIPTRGATAANRWAEVTRGGTPASVNPSRRPGGDPGSAADGGPGEWGGGLGETVPEGIPFPGARPIDVSSPRHPPARQGPARNDRDAHGGVRVPGAPGPGQRRSETGALRKIRESGAIRAIMDTGAMRTVMDTTAMQMLRERYAGRGKAIAISLACLWAVLAAVAIVLVVRHG